MKSATTTTAATALAPAPFIVGTGRCGTTLLRLMLDAHPDLAIPPETHFIPEAVRASRRSGEPARAFVDAILKHRTWPDFHLDGGLLAEQVMALDPFDASVALRTFYRAYADRFGKPRWGEKTPVYASHMRLIQELLPEARFIHLVRDGRDVALSVKEVFFGPKATRDAGQWWAHGIREAHYQARFLNHYLELRYEDLVREPEENLRRICRFLELPWNPVMLDYHKTSSTRLNELEQIRNGVDADQRKGIHQWTTKPPQTSRLARWKKEMTEQDRLEFETEAGPVLTEMGYELSTPTNPAPPQPVWMEQVDLLHDDLRQLIPPGRPFLLIDQSELGELALPDSRRPVPFPNRNGEYWGPPNGDEEAIRQLEELRPAGPSHLVIAWPAFWWIDHYPGFMRHLQSRFPIATRSERLLAFDLQNARPGGEE